MSDAGAQPAAIICPRCGTSIAPVMLACPSCFALVHAAEIQRLAGEAERLAAAGDRTATLTAWRQAVGLLPAASRQHAAVQAKIDEPSRDLMDQPGAARPARPMPKWLAGTGAVGAFIWKFWGIALLLLTKAKLLLLGLTKASTLLSMFLSFGLYWDAFGWRWALGLVATTYVHEMGHVFALRRHGIPASSPMFVPFVGAFVRLRQPPVNPREDAVIGLAGPIWGCGAAAACLAAYFATGWPSFGAAAQTAAWINLFNLLPVWQLDGSRGFRALSRGERVIAAATALAAAYLSGDGILWIVGGAGMIRAFGHDSPAEGDRSALWTYMGLIVVLSMMEQIRILQ